MVKILYTPAMGIRFILRHGVQAGDTIQVAIKRHYDVEFEPRDSEHLFYICFKHESRATEFVLKYG